MYSNTRTRWRRKSITLLSDLWIFSIMWDGPTVRLWTYLRCNLHCCVVWIRNSTKKKGSKGSLSLVPLWMKACHRKSLLLTIPKPGYNWFNFSCHRAYTVFLPELFLSVNPCKGTKVDHYNVAYLAKEVFQLLTAAPFTVIVWVWSRQHRVCFFFYFFFFFCACVLQLIVTT